MRLTEAAWNGLKEIKKDKKKAAYNAAFKFTM
jgi:hypothetical protein